MLMCPGIAKSRVSDDQPALMTFVHTETSRLTNPFPPSLRIAGSKIPACRREAADIHEQLTIGEPDVRNAPLLSDVYAAWACYPRLTLTWDKLKIQTATMDNRPTNSYNGLKSSVSVLKNNRRDRCAFVANHKGLFQVPYFVPFDSHGVTNFFEACFMDDVTRWLFNWETSGANPAFINVLDLWRAMVATYRIWDIGLQSPLWTCPCKLPTASYRCQGHGITDARTNSHCLRAVVDILDLFWRHIVRAPWRILC